MGLVGVGLFQQVADLSSSAPVLASTSTLTYWIYPNSATADPGLVVGNSSTCVALDLVFTDSSTLRDSGAVDQNGIRIHPAQQCGRLVKDAWNQVTVNLGSLQGKTISRVLLGYDQPNVAGGFHTWVDDITMTY
ncbi:MAG TPA: hypothetical protein VM677_12380 [Actinokineospora sp.]|nr:hypothetical protein [Actinokineospora sp.]